MERRSFLAMLFAFQTLWVFRKPKTKKPPTPQNLRAERLDKETILLSWDDVDIPIQTK